MEAIRDVYEELNQPGVQRLAIALRRRRIPFKQEQLRALVAGDETKQLLAPPVRTRGKVTAPGPNVRWAADVVDFTARPSGAARYILVAQDIFTRRLMAKSTTQLNATIIAGVLTEWMQDVQPRELITDGGAEFKASVDRLLEEKGVIHITKARGDHGATATLDRAIQSLKQALRRTTLRFNTTNWDAYLQRVVKGINAAPHQALLGGSPDDANSSQDLQFTLTTMAARDMQENFAEITKRGERLQRAGAFRLPVNLRDGTERLRRRTDAIRWRTSVHRVAAVQHGLVQDEEGQWFPTKAVLPVPLGSRTIEVTVPTRGSDAVRVEQRRRLKAFADRLLAAMPDEGRLSNARAAQLLNRNDELREALRAARAPARKPLAGLVGIFPELFEVAGAFIRRR